MGNNRGIISKKQGNRKMLSVISGICSISIIILVCMQISGIWKTAVNLFEPLLGVLMLLQAIQSWKKSRTVAIVSLCATILIFLVTIFMFINR